MENDSKKFAQMLIVLGIMGFLANGDNYAVAPLLINISSDLGIPIAKTALSVTSYMLCFGFFTIFFGPLGDRYGKTRVINIAAFGTAIFSILGAFSFNLTSLIIFRACNGAFGAGIFPVSIAFIGESSQDANRQKMLGKFFGMMFLGSASATAIGGAIAYFASWRAVYFIYGVLELVMAFIMLKTLEKKPGVLQQLDLRKVYQEAFSNRELIQVVGTIFLIGFSIFGTFTYSGRFIQNNTGYNILKVGLILTFFGAATVLGGRKASTLREILDTKFVPYAAILGAISLVSLSFSHSPILLSISLFGFGYAFVSIHSTLVTTAQGLMPKLRGTVMSLVSFNLFVGGAVGTYVNGIVLEKVGIEWIFVLSAVFMLIILFISTRVVDLSLNRLNKKSIKTPFTGI
ncbi:MFS transporter [Clostridium formicaceticum]|uniref:Multidrug resistance protein 3 n=1 Tax=Clostridium formicaceticum TaxID=1497 RepID=A0AAC9WFK4_9CLOT|nr:MFS transporter [Clostridium formicaceticum]ARE87012.1 Multidrug resistance protein 3 [Clostridium formicaceticum]